MTPAKKKKLKELLLNKQKETLKNLGFWEGIVRDSDPNNNGYANHMADLGTDSMENEKAANHTSRLEKYLKQIDTTLQNISQDDYGICQNCHRDIGFERMQAVPTTHTCTPCGNKKEMAIAV